MLNMDSRASSEIAMGIGVARPSDALDGVWGDHEDWTDGGKGHQENDGSAIEAE
jgi:hypothetical protein